MELHFSFGTFNACCTQVHKGFRPKFGFAYFNGVFKEFGYDLTILCFYKYLCCLTLGF